MNGLLRGIYTSGTAMLTLEKQMNVTANNIANTDTVGYKSDAFVTRGFEDVLIERLRDPSVVSVRREVGPHSLAVYVDELAVDFTQGSIETTNRELDFALAGEGTFFCVQTPQGERYTRAGNFYLDETHRLVTSEGYPVLGENGTITAAEGLIVDGLGNIQLGGVTVDRLKLVDFTDPAALRKEGSTLYANTLESPVQEGTATVKQRFLEFGNVNMSQAATDLMTIQNAFETNQRFVQMQDATLEKAVNQIGKV